MSEIVNKIKQSGLIQMDLADFKPKEEIELFDLKENLWQGIALKEKDFRAFIKENDWTKYQGKVIGVYCSVDAIIPTWAFMLVISKLQEHGVIAFVGDQDEVEKQLILANISAIDLNEYTDGRLIIKGCSDVAHPAFAMTELVKKLQPVVKSIMYGEPCSTVPVYKKKKSL
ncbi:DUF2480 family protein [Brumimicrobium aurantiacum]|uniref:DUF2480 family protein n=1 Tax=Brumimicrobium aurantiacum TaxID=1737063 RepID=A0A3E1EY78_9FLAO|nr:DUF2480 family protein [Brumimicrobium aurantiacum]RFC54487.1 DUF2480 family protein [Brumimicrobium aurantiacum]